MIQEIYYIQIQQMGQGIGSCSLIGFTGILIQILLGAVSFSVLIYKRYTQHPKRVWRIWFLDTSKQGCSQMLSHIINVIISMSLSSQLTGDACLWYFTINILDNTLGVGICLAVLRLVEKLLSKYEMFHSGNYYSEVEIYDESSAFASSHPSPLQISQPRIKYVVSYRNWLVQFIIWNLIVVVSKSVLLGMEILLNRVLIFVAECLIGWVQPYEIVELILVIVVIPVVMNGLAFWIQDNSLKKRSGGRIRESSTDTYTKKEPLL